ncbi:UDP-N-acetylglucosamine--N-acetylmuramyl-(pentapeptide) pyrophosphoryl-undecaprenol N-acetylglucosamine transferase [Rubrimonas cliftonensis]|uniref:UDP-N-acetylglucosamine--N-acetylmuramyl-(pentapeptide) pyrophosphoryl-undecaprenol N-acetylglucosamine transferase n=1 Tax=Rubrimonas cliftonensis TaxID=89524 RepID=A0A1H4B6Z9_9RHOB|nr:UDP-N-acetylglucosamine--N-acetylmuramyl-(pentapeptide) pyrophosphoryl-undecaprenol N-acetylglucosamine transferase [Rubrimonas cliftonensis]SEA43899.1 UDP-N-acetylglucosamine-N-acetylmuramylpentapeptide N-acetylglucosamine transferase [Rubrimonas cliftonensis]
MSAPLLVIAAGGTGGHMFPAQALAEAMLARGWRVTLSTDARGARYADGFPPEVAKREAAAATTAQGGALTRLGAPLTLLKGAAQAWGWMRADRPACVAGFGGYPAFPALAAAWALGLPRLIHEQNGVLGRVNRLFAPRVGAVACGTWPLRNPPPGARLLRMGNPVRPAILAARARYAPPGDGAIELLAFGGSQGAALFARVVPAALRLLPERLRARLRVTLQARPEDLDAARAALHGVTAEVAPFFADMPGRLAAAHLVIARAGASTVAELCAMGRPAILTPYAAAMDDHQTANARALAEAGGAVVIAEDALTPEALAGRLAQLLADDAELAAMAATAARLARPDAADRLAELVERLAAGERIEGEAP